MRSMIILVSWEIWNERNARIFNHKELPHNQLLQKIKDESEMWIMAGAKHLAIFNHKELPESLQSLGGGRSISQTGTAHGSQLTLERAKS